MTTYAIVGGDQWHEFATVRGTGDFIRWVDSLDSEVYPRLAHFSDWGWVNEIEELQFEIESAMEDVEPSQSLRKTLDAFLSALESRGNAESVVLTDGLVPDDDEDGEWIVEP
jgi:hypothetical protein